MGLSIHYSGRIADKNTLPQLMEEMEEIAIVHGWKYSIYEREFPGLSSESATLSGALTNKNEEHDGKLYGIEFTPEGSEPVSLCFLSNGRMSSIMQLACWGEFNEEKTMVLYNAEVSEDGKVEIRSEELKHTAEDFNRYLYLCSTKTQYAGPRAHEMIIAVFRYINKTYLAEFRMVDEAEFWETGDEELLLKNFEFNTALINGFAASLTENTKHKDESLDSYLERIIREFRKKNKD